MNNSDHQLEFEPLDASEMDIEIVGPPVLLAVNDEIIDWYEAQLKADEIHPMDPRFYDWLVTRLGVDDITKISGLILLIPRPNVKELLPDLYMPLGLLDVVQLNTARVHEDGSLEQGSISNINIGSIGTAGNVRDSAQLKNLIKDCYTSQDHMGEKVNPRRPMRVVIAPTSSNRGFASLPESVRNRLFLTDDAFLAGLLPDKSDIPDR